jgi:hypothetical protein
MAQAEAILHGRLHVDEQDLASECFNPLSITAGIVLAYWAALRLLHRSLLSPTPTEPRRLVLWCAILGAAALGPGSTLLLISRPAVFEEAITWSIPFVLLTLNHVWAWHAGERKSLFPGVLFGIAAANARPAPALMCAVLGVIVAALWYRVNRRDDRRVLAAALCLSLLPALTAGAVFWMRLQRPIPTPLLNEQLQTQPWWLETLLTGPGFQVSSEAVGAQSRATVMITGDGGNSGLD